MDYHNRNLVESEGNIRYGTTNFYIFFPTIGEKYHSYYQNHFGLKKGILPRVEELFPRLLTIPLFPKMSDADEYDVINALEKFIKYCRI